MTPFNSPKMRDDLPRYPITDQLIRVTRATVAGPSGVSQLFGSSVLAPILYVAFVQQLRTDSLLPRDREPCLADDVNGLGLTEGFYHGRLQGSWTSLPVYTIIGRASVQGNTQDEWWAQIIKNSTDAARYSHREVRGSPFTPVSGGRSGELNAWEVSNRVGIPVDRTYVRMRYGDTSRPYLFQHDSLGPIVMLTETISTSDICSYPAYSGFLQIPVSGGCLNPFNDPCWAYDLARNNPVMSYGPYLCRIVGELGGRTVVAFRSDPPILTGNGPPTSPPDNTTTVQYYFDQINHIIWVWDIVAGVWITVYPACSSLFTGSRTTVTSVSFNSANCTLSYTTQTVVISCGRIVSWS